MGEAGPGRGRAAYTTVSRAAEPWMSILRGTLLQHTMRAHCRDATHLGMVAWRAARLRLRRPNGHGAPLRLSTRPGGLD